MGRGGARFGAGRPETRPKVEHLMQLRVKDLGHFGVSSARDLRELGSASLILRSRDPNWHFFQRIELTLSACHFGGERVWFRCAGCARRAGLLLMSRGTFVCRHCAGGNYRSQALDPISRSWKRQRAIEARIGSEGSPKPRGMRWTTHAALKEQIAALTTRRWKLAAGMVRRAGTRATSKQ